MNVKGGGLLPGTVPGWGMDAAAEDVNTEEQIIRVLHCQTYVRKVSFRFFLFVVAAACQRLPYQDLGTPGCSCCTRLDW